MMRVGYAQKDNICTRGEEVLNALFKVQGLHHIDDTPDCMTVGSSGGVLSIISITASVSREAEGGGGGVK